MSTICATKRDLERIAKKRYVFDERLFNVYIIHKGNTALNLGQEYSIKKEGDYYYLYNLLSNTGCYLDPLILVDVVCENFEVLITNEVVSKPARGRLILKNHLYDKTTTKEEVESSDCTIKPEFLDIVSEFTDNRIIQELYIGEPINASVWYDGRYLDIVRINESFFFPTKNAGDYTGLTDRTGSDKYSNEQLKDLARSTFICKVGDYLKIKNISEKTIVLQKLLSYDSYSELLITNYVLSPNEYFDFVVREDCFVVFNILNLQGALDGYWLTSSCPSDYNFKLTANSTDITNTKKFVSKSLAVSLLASISNYYIYDEKKKIYYLNDGVGDKVLENILITITGTKPDSSNVFTSSDSFNDFSGDLTFGTSFIPTSDCHITVTVKFTTDSGDIVLENDNGSSPGYTLYIKGNVPVTINNKTYSPESSILFESDSNLTASWSLDAESYEVLLQYYINKYYLKNYLTESKSISFDMISDLILTVNTVSADCIYIADKKVILQLDFEPENSVKLHKTFNNKTHVIDTENQIYSSSMPNEFLNSDITSISYYTDKDQFAVTSKAFKDCTQLNTVSIEGPQLQINNEAFKNTIALNEVKGIENTLFLGNLAFYNSGLKSFHSNNAALTTINLSAFELCERLLKVLLNELKLASIRESAFKNTPSLKLVKLPKSVNNIEKEAFAYSGINKIVTSDSHSSATDGFWFVTDDKTNGLSVIEEGVFKGCDNLVSASLPVSILYIDLYAFADDINLTLFESYGLWHVAKDSFKGTLIDKPTLSHDECQHLTSGLRAYIWGDYMTHKSVGHSYIHPDSSGLYIYYKLFKRDPFHDLADAISVTPYACYKKGYNAIRIGRSMKDIGEYAFYSAGLETVAAPTVVGESFRPQRYDPYYKYISPSCTIHKYAFAENKKLREFYMEHDNLHYIHDHAFLNCVDLIPINFARCGVKYIGDFAFDNASRYAFDKYNSLRWTENIVVTAALFVYGYLSSLALISAYPEITPAKEVVNLTTTPDYETYETIITNDTVFIPGEEKLFRYFEFTLNGQPIDYNNPPWKNNNYFTFNATPEQIEQVLSTLDIMNTANEYADELADVFKDTIDQYTQDGWIIGDGDAAGNYIFNTVDVVDLTKKFGNKFIQWFGGSPIHIRECYRIIGPGRFSTKCVELIKSIVKGATKYIVTTVSAPVMENILEIGGFVTTVAGVVIGAYELVGAIHNVIWSAYKFPIIKSIYSDNIKYTGSLSFTTGIGMDVDRGVYTLTFPSTIEYIGKYAFRNNKDVRNIIFLESPSKIEEGVFEGCEYLRSVQVCKEVTDENGTVNLQDDITNYHITHISNRAFMHCNLDSMEINKIILQTWDVGDYAFAYNKRIWVNYTYNWDIETIKQYVTYIIDIPPTLKTIGKYAFGGANLIRFNAAYPNTFNIDPKAFAYYCPYNDWGGNMDTSGYLYAADRVAIVPELYLEDYINYFNSVGLLHTGTLSGGFSYIVTYNENNEFTSMVHVQNLI